MNREEIYNYCKNIVKKENITFTYFDSKKEEIDLNKFSIEKYTNNISQSLFIRIIENKNFGTYKVENITKENILKGINKAKEIAKFKKSDVKFTSFGNEKNNKKIKFDKEICKINFSEFYSEIKENLVKEKYITGYLGGLVKNQIDSFIINPYTEKTSKKSYIYLATSVLTKNKEKSSGDFESIYTRKKDIDISKNFLQAKINAYNLLDPKNGKQGEYTLILIPEITRELIGFILSGTKGDVIEEKKSFLYNQINKQTFSKNLTLKEEPNLDYFLKSQEIDDEGYKTNKKEIFEKGVFKKPIYDLYNSIKYKKSPTGNGFISNNYYASYTNKIQTPGKEKIDEIISKTKKGILIYGILGLHTNEITTGDFSVTISSGKIIENGQFKETVTNLNLTGNLKEMLKEVYFSKEQMFFGDSLYSFTIIPKIKII
jgi:predicted Zn-dependent protease